jgi:N6-adenosine-specific RNA methylase IME4
MLSSTLMLISQIKVGFRHRQDMGNIGELAQSIEQVGLLHPVVVSAKSELIAGERRLLAFQRLGRTDIPATIIDLESLVIGEQAENIERKDFTIAERVAIGEAIEKLARKRENFPTLQIGGRITEFAATKAGFRNRKTYEQAKHVIAAGGKPLADMNRTGRVNGPYKRVKVAGQAAVIRSESPPLPNRGPYRVIVADPPWPYEIRKNDPSHRATHPYPQMSIAQICAVDIGSLAHSDCLLWLWTTNHHMREAFAVLDAWGFVQKTILTWAKDRMGTGDWLRGQTEHCLLAVKGKPTVQLTNQTTLLCGPLRKNSQKPSEFYEFVEKLCPAPRYAYLFSREQRERWDMHGDEVANGVAA